MFTFHIVFFVSNQKLSLIKAKKEADADGKLVI